MLNRSVEARFIPTGVGNAFCFNSPVSVFTVHPHGCGERFPEKCKQLSIHGSSPRVWGTLLRYVATRSYCRFIPTGVGNAWPPVYWQCASSVHPHGCGEREVQQIYPDRRDGSSPRVWGTRVGVTSTPHTFRFIPTGVGNAGTGVEQGNFSAVHPHGCGERTLSGGGAGQVTGSSPRVWGTRHPEK